jgi:predicted PurR-regulated permease PerM
MGMRDERSGRVLLIVAVLLLAYAAARVLQPAASVLAATAVIAVVIHPLYARLLARLPGRPSAAAAAATAAACVLLAVPLAVGGTYLVREFVHAYPVIREQAQSLAGPAESVPAWVPQGARGYLQDLSLRDLVLENIREVGAWSGRLVTSTVGSAAAIAVDVIVFVLCLFLFLRDGRETVARLAAAVPLEARVKERILERTHDMVVATIQGVFAVALLQGTLAAAGFALLGVRFPVLLGALCMLFSPIPIVGPAIVWVPVVAGLALEGQFGRAALVAVWFALLVGTADNVVRPFLVGSRSHLPAAIVVVGVFGGIQAFGVVGTFLGPIVLAIVAAALDALFLSPEHGSSTARG